MRDTIDRSIVSTSSTKKRFLCNIGSGWLTVMTNILVGVFTLPINLHYLGKEVYGVSVLATSVLLILHQLNFGMGPTLVRFFSQAVADGDDDVFRKTSSTAQVFTGGVGLIGGVVFMACFHWFCERYEISGELKTSTFFLFCGMAFMLWEQLYTITFGAILQSFQRLDVSNYTRSALITMRVILLVIFYKFVSRTLISLGIVLCLESTLRLLVLFSFALRYGGSKTIFSPKNIDVGLVPKLFSFGALVFLNSLSYGLSIQIPCLIIGAQLGNAAVADFSAAHTVSSFLSSILAVIVVPLTPLACIEAKKGGERLGVWAVSIGQVVACIGCCTVLIICLFGDDWITVWLGPSFAWTRLIVIIMATASVLATISNTNYTIALGASTIAPVAWSSFVMAIMVTAGTWIGLHWHLFESISVFHLRTQSAIGSGLLGVACLIFFVRVVRNVFFLTGVYSKKFNYSFWKYVYKVFLVPFAMMFLVILFWNITLEKFDYTSMQRYLEDWLQTRGLTKIESRLSLACITGLKSALASTLFLSICWLCILSGDLKRSLFQTLWRR